MLGMSGGVDSAVSAVLLRRAGYEVIGLTCLFLDDPSSRTAAEDAAAVCARLGITHHVFDAIECFEQMVVQPFVEDYRTGTTPSPCVGCNVFCKIPSLLEYADKIGIEKVATGHYARVAQLIENDRFVVKAALDSTKDQSYMLSRLGQQQLSRLVLPLGAMTKVEVRILAEDEGLSVAQKQESQDICFIQGSHRDFLMQRGVLGAPGDIVDSSGKILGRHEGLFAYTIGQRKGIGVAAAEPYYVIEKRSGSNELVIGFKNESFIEGLELRSLIWQSFESPPKRLECMVKLRYRSSAVACVVEGEGESARVKLRSPQPTTAPGQFAVFYQGETVLGGGVIESVDRILAH